MELLLHQIVNGEGLGKILRLGVKKAAERIGGGASLYAAHAKGLELSAYHPAAIMGSALGYAVSSRGGDYNNIYASLEYSWTEAEAEKAFGTKEAVNIHSIAAKGRLIRKAVTANIIIDCLGLCKVPALSLLRSFDLGHETELINGLTGQHLTGEDLSELGTEIASLEKRFNIRHAPAEMEDTLPQMFFETAKSEGLTRQNFESMRSEYYDAMGWGNSGIPPGPDDGPVS
jgi:aldehyde:ferredoxin oxidoreductase